MNNREFIRTFIVAGNHYSIYDITALQEKRIAQTSDLPFCIKVLVENALRKLDGKIVREQDLLKIARWQKSYKTPVEIPFHPSRVLMQDFTGVPAVVDLAAMRDVMAKMGGDPKKINPLVPVDLVVDHSVQVDFYGTAKSENLNVTREYQKNIERYALLKWAQASFDKFRVIPPRSGICHQVNLEYLSRVIVTEENEGICFAYPETLIGTDSHTTMINSIGVLGWGVGGIEAEAVMLGQPYYMTIPEVVGVKLTGQLETGVTAMDMALLVTSALRKYEVVGKFVEYFGPGMKKLSIAERATLTNMAPEYGATIGFMPVDEKTIEYLTNTNRASQAEVVEVCTKSLGLFYTGEIDPEYSDVLEIDLASVQPAVAGPSRPHEHILLRDLKKSFSTVDHSKKDGPPKHANLPQYVDKPGLSTNQSAQTMSGPDRFYEVEINGKEDKIGNGSIVMAAITSCTNTSNPCALIGAGLVARNAVKRGLRIPAYVKTVLAPGSKVVPRYLESACLSPYLESLGFHTAGFGCMTCIGNSGPLNTNVEQVVKANSLNVVAVISGNRNFEARIHPQIRWNFLASPMLVVAFALAGRIDIDFGVEAVGADPNGQSVYLKDLWPKNGEIEGLVETHCKPELFASEYERIFYGDDLWQGLKVHGRAAFAWAERSSYIKTPPYFEGFALETEESTDISGARALLLLGDSVTTDHISPGGSIPEEYPAGQYLLQLGVKPAEFNSYGSRRGNHEVMMRGTFSNIRLENKLVAPKEGGFTKKFPEEKTMYVYDAAMSYKSKEIPLIVIGGCEYGTGSSRDWAAKGTSLLGVKAVLAKSFERIHRSNLVGMGILPLTFMGGDSYQSIGINGSETFNIIGMANLQPRKTLKVIAIRPDSSRIEFGVTASLDTAVEVTYFENGGILPFVLRKILRD